MKTYRRPLIPNEFSKTPCLKVFKDNLFALICDSNILSDYNLLDVQEIINTDKERIFLTLSANGIEIVSSLGERPTGAIEGMDFSNVYYIRNEFDNRGRAIDTIILFKDDNRFGMYSTQRGWLYRLSHVDSVDVYEHLFVIDSKTIISSKGDIVEGALKEIAKYERAKLFQIDGQERYFVVDENDFYEGKQGTFNNEDVIIFNIKKDQVYIYDKNKERFYYEYTGRDSYVDHCEDYGPQWTDEDSWDAMTDGQYGEYNGSGWNMDMFG